MVKNGFESHYSGDMVLHMNVPLYGTKQVEYCFFKTFKKHVRNMTCKQSHADPCFYFTWRDNVFVVLVARVDDVIILGPPNMAQQDLERAFICIYKGELMEYVGSKLTLSRDDSSLGMVKFTQPVLVKKLEEEYTPPNGVALKTPAVAGQLLVKGDGDGMVQE
ncbi:LOW QUALITY PROTEIN: hypothetical protein ACHAW6_000026 [Cyclotella cf. meneghiniana]